MAETPDVTVIIPTWNGKHHLALCLPALAQQTYDNFEILVVDNGSSDGTVEWLRAEWPDVRVIALAENYGFVGGVNAGIVAAQGNLLALLNNDTEAESSWLEHLIAGLQRHPEAGMAASKLKLWDDRSRIHSAGDYYTRGGRPGNRGFLEKDDGRFDTEEFVFGPCAAAALYRREIFDRVGLFDRRFGSYLEDVDLAWRAQHAGWKCIFVPDAVVYHKVSATGGGPIASFYNGRNWLYVIAKDYPLSLLRHHWRDILREQLTVTRQALRAWRGDAARARLRGQLAGILMLPRMWLARREVARDPSVRDADLAALLS